MRERELGEYRLKDIDRPERIYQLDVDGLQSSFPPLRTHDEEPLDFDKRLERRIESYVESQLERAFTGGAKGRGENDLAEAPEKLIRLAAGGLFIAFLGLALLAVMIVGIVLLVRFVF